MKRSLILLAALTLALPAWGQSFSCQIGTQPTCLDYNEEVCSRNGKCVERDAACFEQYQCNYEGFTCKSNVTECVLARNDLLRKHNTLVDEYNKILREQQKLVAELEEALGAFVALKSEYGRLELSFEEVNTCLINASTFDESKACAQ